MNDAYRAGGPHQGELAQIRSAGQDVEISSGRARLQHCGPVRVFFDSQTPPGGYCHHCDSCAIFGINSLVRFGMSKYWGSATVDCLCPGSASDARQGHPSEFVSEGVNI